MSKKGGSAPSADPNIGLAAMKEAELGEQWLALSKDQYAIANERQTKLDDLTAQVTGAQITSLNNANTWAGEDRERYKSVFQPMEDAYIDKAKNWDSAENQAKAASEAKADVQNAAANAQQTRGRQMSAMGINPASGRFAGIESSADTATALASAGAQNNARTTLKNQAVAMQADAINMGKGLPSQATQALGLGVNTGNSVVGNNTSVNNAWLGNNSLLQSGYQTAMTGYGQQATILNSLYGNQIKAWSASQQDNSGLGSALGYIVNKAIPSTGLSILSDEDAKTDKQPVSGMLNAVKGLPIEEWTYKPGAGDGGRHIGTYAEHFQRQTGKGDGKTIPVVDAIGVTMGAVQELDAKVDRLARSIGSFADFQRGQRGRRG